MCLAKPSELLALVVPAEDVFVLLRDRFDVHAVSGWDLAIDDPARFNFDPLRSATLAMHFVSHLRHYGRPDVKVEVAVVVGAAQQVHALLTAVAPEYSRSDGSKLLQFRDQAGVAAAAIIEADVASGRRHRYLV